MKKQILAALAASLLAVTAAPGFARTNGGEAGGGGGGMVINGKVYTMAQAGLTIAEPTGEEPFSFDAPTIKATRALLAKVEAILPNPNAKSLLREAIFGNNHSYRKIEVVEPALFERMKREYRKYVESLPESHGQFVLAAFTQAMMTNLFPDFFAADDKTRAIYLFHEAAFVINAYASLETVLKFEVALVNFDTAPTPENIWQLQKAFAGIGLGAEYSMKNELSTLFLKSLLDRGIQLKLSALLDEDIALRDRDRSSLSLCRFAASLVQGKTGVEPVDNNFVLMNKHIHPEFTKMVLGRKIQFEVAWILSKNYSSPLSLGAGIPLVCQFKNQRPDNFVLRSLNGRVVLDAIDKTTNPEYKHLVTIRDEAPLRTVSEIQLID